MAARCCRNAASTPPACRAATSRFEFKSVEVPEVWLEANDPRRDGRDRYVVRFIAGITAHGDGRPTCEDAVRSTRYVAVLLALLPPAAQARIEIVIPKSDGAIQNNVRAFLSLTRYAERDDVTARKR